MDHSNVGSQSPDHQSYISARWDVQIIHTSADAGHSQSLAAAARALSNRKLAFHIRKAPLWRRVAARRIPTVYGNRFLRAFETPKTFSDKTGHRGFAKVFAIRSGVLSSVTRRQNRYLGQQFCGEEANEHRRSQLQGCHARHRNDVTG